VIHTYRASAKLTTTLYSQQCAAAAGYKSRVFGNKLQLDGIQQAHLVLGTIKTFCQSADPTILSKHVPRHGRLLALGDAMLAEIRKWVVAEAAKLWGRMTDSEDALPMGHDGYLKLWALQRPKLYTEYVLLDEAQDTNQAVLGVLRNQTSQIVYVGDRHQQIYEWRGAVNAMEKVTGCDEATLTQSFRFGEPIAAPASLVLRTLGESQPLRGNPKVQSVIVDEETLTRAVLARTNATVIVEALRVLDAGRKASIVGGTTELARLLRDVEDLKNGNPAASPEFFGYTRWKDVVEFSESEEGEAIRSFVQLVENYGEHSLWPAVNNAHQDENTADVVISTAHKAKGREWRSVRLTGDFVSTRSEAEQPQNDAESRLFYVAMTRAKHVLAVDPRVLAHFTNPPVPAETPRAAGSELR
jgi:hypothetical protein